MNEAVRVAVASRSFSRHPVLRRELTARFPSATFNDAGRSLSGAALIDFLRGHERAITALEPLDASLFAALPELRVISKYGVGLDMIDLAAMDRAGVALGWTPGVNRRSVAELTIAAAIALLHGVPAAGREVREGIWRQTVGRQLTGRTLSILGCGHVGREVAMLARPFGCDILVHDIVDLTAFCREHGARQVDLDTALARAEIVTLHLPLDASTRGLIDAEKLSRMPAGAVLINMARGGIVDEPALLASLTSGRLAGAALDVFAEEPPVDRRLIDLPNVMVTPHIGGSTEEAIVAMGRAAIDGLDSARQVRAIPALPGRDGLR